LGFVVGALIGGFLYSRSPESAFITTAILLLVFAALSGLRIRRPMIEE